MKHVFVDTNVIIDFLANRKPFALEAAKLFDYAVKKKITVYVAAVSYNNIYYVLRHSLSHAATVKVLDELQQWTEVLDVTKSIIKKSVHSEFKDFEDAIQYYCAKSESKVDCIVTRNAKDFRASSLSILSPKEVLAVIEQE